MKCFRRCFLIATLVFTASVLASNGDDLLNRCKLAMSETYEPKSAGEGFAVGYCLGLVGGIWDMNQTWSMEQEIFHDGKLRVFCPPEAIVSRGQVARVVIKYLEERPEKLHERDTLLVRLAMIDAFPCNKPDSE